MGDKIKESIFHENEKVLDAYLQLTEKLDPDKLYKDIKNIKDGINKMNVDYTKLLKQINDLQKFLKG